VGVKRPGREADHSPQSSVEVNNAWNYISIPQYIFMGWYSVKKEVDERGETCKKCSFGRKPECKRTLERNMRGRNDNTKTDLKKLSVGL